MNEQLNPIHEATPATTTEGVQNDTRVNPPLTVPSEPELAVGKNGHSQRRAEAGRKGAQRIHQLIQEGRLYEQEHGLKRGRQRLRQLIELGKLYEQEHGMRRPDRPRRVSDEQALRTLLQALVRLVKPPVRERLKAVLAALGDVT